MTIRDDVVAHTDNLIKSYQATLDQRDAEIAELRRERDDQTRRAGNFFAETCRLESESTALKERVARLEAELAEERAKPKLTVRQIERAPFQFDDEDAALDVKGAG